MSQNFISSSANTQNIQGENDIRRRQAADLERLANRPDAENTPDDPDPEPAILDREVALARVGGDVGLLQEIAQLFLEDYPRSLGDLRAAAAQGDSRSVERAAHGLKGAVANFGAEPVVHAAAMLEQMGRARDLSQFATALNSLERALSALDSELKSL